MFYLRLKTLNQDGNQQIEEHIVSKRHESYEVESGAGRGGCHAIVEHHVPVLLSQNLQQTCAQSEIGDTQKQNRHRSKKKKKSVGAIEAYEFACFNYSYLKNSDDGPKQGVKVLPVRHCVSCFCLQTKLTAKYVHPQDAATQTRVSSNNYYFNFFD